MEQHPAEASDHSWNGGHPGIRNADRAEVREPDIETLVESAEQGIFHAAIEAADRGNLTDATRLWRQAVALAPQAGLVALQLGIVCFHREDLQAAEKAFSAAAATLAGDDLTPALNGLAAVERGRRRFWRAQRRLEMAIALSPSDPVLWSNRADIARVRALHDIAYRSILRGLALDSMNVDIQHNYALVLSILPAEAARAGVMRLSESRDRRVLMALPSILASNGHYEEALAAAQGCERLFPGDAPLALESGRIHFALGHVGAAARSYRCAVGLAPELRKGSGRLREVTLLTERDLPMVSEPPSVAEPNTGYAQYLAHVDEAIVLKESWAAISPEGKCYLRRFTPASDGAMRYFPQVVFLHEQRMLTAIPNATTTGASGAVLIGGCLNFSHWINDWSSKLRLTTVRDDLRKRPLIVDDRIPEFAYDLMRALGVETDRLLPQSAVARHYRDLWLPSMDHRYQEMPPAHAAWLRARLAVPHLPQGRARRLFMSRRNARYRRIANMSEIEPIIRRFGLEEVHPETMSWAAQLDMFSQAELWLGVVGGGSASILLCPTTCQIIELTHRRLLLNQYERVSSVIGQTFRRIVGEVIHLDGKQPDYDFDWDVVVPPDELERHLRELLG